MWPYRVIVLSNVFIWNLNAPCTGNLECCFKEILWSSPLNQFGLQPVWTMAACPLQDSATCRQLLPLRGSFRQKLQRTLWPQCLRACRHCGHNVRGLLAWHRRCDTAAVEASQTACSEHLWIVPQRLSNVWGCTCLLINPHATRQDANPAHCPHRGKWAGLAKWKWPTNHLRSGWEANWVV